MIGVRQASAAAAKAPSKTYVLNLGEKVHLRLSVGVLGVAIILILATLLGVTLLLALLAHRRRRQVEKANRKLEIEISDRIRAENEVNKLNADLERKVVERTRQLRDANMNMALRNAELLALNKELESFSYSVSHDLRAPLRAISGFSAIVLEDSADKLDAEGKADLERIRAATLHMGEMIEGMLHLARTTRCEMHRERVDLSGLARGIVSRLQASEPQRHVEFSIAPDLTVQGDRVLLQSMLENLLGNAWKFTSKRPDGHVVLGIQSSGSQPIYFVRDNGAGFDPRYADKLFGAFQRLHRDSEFSGTGIGLATVQRIIQRHGGRIWAESEVGKGATFYFALEPDYESRTEPEDSPATSDYSVTET
jgi:light-regulated signal transduction histidine kinase (bacteriophytochrome)